MRTLILSGRADHRHLADACAYDAEDVAMMALGADLMTSQTDIGTLAERYDLALVVGVSFSRAIGLTEGLLASVRDRIDGPVLSYVFGAYGSLVAATRHPLRGLIGPRKTKLSGFDRIYLGIADEVDEIAHSLNVKTRYLPMAANVLGAAARPYLGPGDRPIALNAFGRQKTDILNAFCDRLNRPGSADLVYCTNLVHSGDAADLTRYRAMFWQLLRQSRLSTAFDHFFTDPERAKLSYVGPRWFESLAAGNVVIGRAPPTADCAELLDWPDATIDLSADPVTATDELIALLKDDARIQSVSRENLVQMSLRHDWAHRLAEMLDVEGIERPATLTRYLAKLHANAQSFREPRMPALA